MPCRADADIDVVESAFAMLVSQCATCALPMGRPVGTLEAAVGALCERLTCDPRRKTERAQQPLTGLWARGGIRVEKGLVCYQRCLR